jgi:hypothetical protein
MRLLCPSIHISTEDYGNYQPGQALTLMVRRHPGAISASNPLTDLYSDNHGSSSATPKVLHTRKAILPSLLRYARLKCQSFHSTWFQRLSILNIFSLLQSSFLLRASFTTSLARSSWFDFYKEHFH